MQASPGIVTFLFTDIEGSTRLWEREPERMRPALARHDALARTAIERHRGVIVKMAGDGAHAAFDDPLDAVAGALELQQALADPQTTHGITFRVRCGLHAGAVERRDNDFFGSAVNRAARITGVAHGGQVLLSEAVAVLIRDRLPADVSLRDLGSVRLRDLAEAERIYQVVHPQLRADFPALRALEATPNNLPEQLTSFVGRERELAEIAKSLDDSRLLTLLGVGGIGKTRLSLQVAAEMLDEFPDGVWLVEFAPLTDAQLVPQAVASVLGVKEEAGSPLVDALKKHVKDRQLLLILDNCEHLVHACAELAKLLLEAGRGLKILASSREHLHLSGEATYPVPGLAVPDILETITPAALTQYESVRLFIDRAVAAQPAFAVTDQNAVVVGEVCRRLDGIPLAIELAAARVRALSVENIAARLNDRFRLLTSGSRTALPRQQTLRALIDWSYDLLDQRERAVLRRLAVFAGGWTLDAVEAVAADGDVRESDVLDLLTHLVEKSLVVVEAGGGRYRLLDTVRQYAQERLTESGEEDSARMRHLACYVALAEKASPQLTGPQQGVWLSRLDLERENILGAHEYCARVAGGAELGLRLASAVKRYWIFRGLMELGHRITFEALQRRGADERNFHRCRVLFDAGQLGCWMGNYREAQSYLVESLDIAREISDKTMVAKVLQPLGLALQGLGDLVTARGYLEEALALAEKAGDKREIAGASNALAQLHRMQGHLDMSEPLYNNVVSLARELADGDLIAIGLLNLAMVAIGRESSDRVEQMLLEVLGIAEEIGSKPAGQSVLEVSAGLAALRGEWERVARLYGAAEAQTGHTGLHRDPADEAFLSPLITKAQTALGANQFATAESGGRALSYEQAMVEVRTWLEARP